MNCWMAGFGVFDNSPVDVMTRRAPLQQPQPAACCGFAHQETRDVAAEVSAQFRLQSTQPIALRRLMPVAIRQRRNAEQPCLRSPRTRLRATRSWRIRLAFD